MTADSAIQDLMRDMRAIQAEIVAAVREAVGNAKPDAKYWAAKEARISDLYERALVRWTVFAKSILPEFYDHGADTMRAKLHAAGLKPLEHKKTVHAYTPLDDILTASGASSVPSNLARPIDAIIRDSIAAFSIASDNGQKNITRLFHATQQTAIKEEQINKAIGAGMVTDNTPRSIKNAIQQELEDAIGEGGVLDVNGQDWQIDTYSELVARTRSREAQTVAAKETMLEFGQDLVQWIGHAGMCPECEAHAGEIYSITGSSDTYDTLDEEPPLHPNCECSLGPYIEEPAQEDAA